MSDNPEIVKLLEQAKGHMKARQYDQAIAIYQRALLMDDEEVSSHQSLATAYTLDNKLEKAIEHFKIVAQLAPRNAAAYINMGALYNRLGDYPNAVEMCRKGLQIDRKSADGYYNQALAYRKMNQLALAVPAYREAVRLNPQFIEAHQNLANVFLAMKNLQQAIHHFRQALAIDPEFTKAQVGLEKALAEKDGQKTSVNPFGRLVKEEEIVSKQDTIDSIRFRTLTPAERQDDRIQLQVLNRTIFRMAREVQEVLVKKIEPEIRAIDQHALSNNLSRSNSMDVLHPLMLQFENAARNLTNLMEEMANHQSRMMEKQTGKS